MAALQCEICGGKLIGKPGGRVGRCDSCGMACSTEIRAKAEDPGGPGHCSRWRAPWRQ